MQVMAQEKDLIHESLCFMTNHLEFVETFRDIKLFSQMSDRDICHNPCPGGFCRIPCDDNFGCSPVTVTFWSLSRFWREGPESVTDLGILTSSITFFNVMYILSAPSVPSPCQTQNQFSN